MKTLQLLILLLCSNVAFSQTGGIIFSINDGHTGTGLHLGYTKSINERIDLGVGIRYHINPAIKWRDAALMNHTFYAQNSMQRMGLSSFFEYKIKVRDWKAKPFFGYHTQILSTARKYVSFGDNVVQFEWNDPLIAWDNLLRAGMNFSVNPNWNIKANTGVGFSFFYNIDDRQIDSDKNPGNNKTWQTNYEFSLSVIYSLNPKE